MATSSEQKAWLVRIARFGYAAKGLVYTLVGALALGAAFGTGQASDKQGALESLLAAPFGLFVLLAAVVGLVAYALWRFIQAVLDTENDGADASGVIKRGAYLVSGLGYLLLAGASGLSVFQRGSQGSGLGSEVRKAAYDLIAQPVGRFLVIGIGLVIIAVAFYQFYEAYRASFRDELEGSLTWLVYFGRVGYASRGVIYLLIGSFFIRAGFDQNLAQAGGISKALRTLEQQPFGPWLLSAVAVGLMLFGLYTLLLAWYRQFEFS